MELSSIFFCIALVGLAACAAQVWAVHKTLSRKDNILPGDTAEDGVRFPPVSVLKPLKGLDDNLFDNLESICAQDYPAYEVIFALQDPNDPAHKVAQKVKEKYPGKDITILIARCTDGLNPKVNNLIPACRRAKYEQILISDSNVHVSRHYLKAIASQAADPRVGLVSNVIVGVGGRSLGAVLENLHLNSFVIGSVCFLNRTLKMPCVVGKSMLMKKSDLEAIGGLHEFKDVLAEDYLIGKKMREGGKKVVLSHHLVRNVNDHWDIRRFLNRHSRWGKLRWKIGGLSYLSELIANPVFVSLLPLLFLEISRTTIFFTAFVSAVKSASDMWIGKMLARANNSIAEQRDGLSTSAPRSVHPLWYVLTPLKDMVIGFMWFVPFVSTTVVWRGNRYIIGKESRLYPFPETGFWSWPHRLAHVIRTRFA